MARVRVPTTNATFLEEKMNWKQIIVTALITLVSAIVPAIITIWWTNDKSELTYNSIRSVPFNNESNALFIQQVEAKNSGRETAEDVTLTIKFDNAVIKKYNIDTSGATIRKKEIGDNYIKANFEYLNPGEVVLVSILYQSSNASKSKDAFISLRGKGVVGKPLGKEKKITTKRILLNAVFVAYFAVFSFILTTKTGRKIFFKS